MAGGPLGAQRDPCGLSSSPSSPGPAVVSAAGLLCCAGDASGTHTAGGSPGHTEQSSYFAILSHAAVQSVGSA